MTLPQEVICQLSMPEYDHLIEHIKENVQWVRRANQMVALNGHAGQTVNICGAGPTLAAQHDALRSLPAHQTWGCNSALPYLHDHHIPVTHGFAVDQGVEMLHPEEWQRTFDVTYLISSSVHPKLTAHLVMAKRRVRWFHNYQGFTDPEGWIPPAHWKKPTEQSGYEMYLYQTVWPAGVQVGYGLNSVPRAACLALWMGFKTVRIFGADCAAAVDSPPMCSQIDPGFPAWLDSVRLYADGRTARHYGDNAIMVESYICEEPTCDCRSGHPSGVPVHRWHTRADMVISAVHLVDLAKAFPGRILLMGPTLPQAMLHKPPSFFEAIPKLTGKGSISGFTAMRSPT